MMEMHIIAYVYHWGRDELKSLPRNERKRWYELILEQKRIENREVDKSELN